MPETKSMENTGKEQRTEKPGSKRKRTPNTPHIDRTRRRIAQQAASALPILRPAKLRMKPSDRIAAAAAALIDMEEVEPSPDDFTPNWDSGSNLLTFENF